MDIKDIRKILILGAGTMGQQIGLLCAFHGYDVVIYDLKQDILDNAYSRIQKRADKWVLANQFPPEKKEPALRRITMTDNLDKAAEGVDLISESVPEDPELKGGIFHEFHKRCKRETIFTTNTSSLLPSMFANKSGRPDRLCALHFHDISITNIVDVMPHADTSPDVTELVTSFARAIGQIPIVLKRENNGYVFNNMLMALMDSALSMASHGIAPIEEIDRSWMGIMHTLIGPFGIMDSIGLDTVWKVTDYWARQLNNGKAITNAAFVKKYVDEGKLGLKSGHGFYGYPEPAYARPDFISGISHSSEEK
ncbi:MAG: 3-hydroxyacyl-CoA dehydrogenase [Pseudomonadota bacterium]